MRQLQNLVLFLLAIITQAALGQTGPVGSISSDLSVSPSGGAMYSIPIEVPPGVVGMAPNLSIVYNSQSGNGVCGWGCNLSGTSVITRGAKDVWHDGAASGVSYSDNDAFYLDGQRLIEIERIQGADSIVYCLENDPYVRVVKHNSISGGWFSTYSRDGRYYEYGKGNAQQYYLYFGNLIKRTNAWYVCKVTDACGNYMDYNYTQNNLYVYLSSISYGQNNNSGNSLNNLVTFTYQKRMDAQGFSICGKTGAMKRRLQSITSKTNDSIYRIYSLVYVNDSGIKTPSSRLKSITVSNGHEQMRPIQLTWVPKTGCQPVVETPNVTFQQSTGDVELSSDFQLMSSDFNGDGISDIVQCVAAEEHGVNTTSYYTYLYFYCSHLDENSGAVTFSTPSLFKLDPSIDAGDWSVKSDAPMVADIDGDGLNDFIIHYTYNVGSTASIQYIIYGKNICAGNGQIQSTTRTLNHTVVPPLVAASDFDNNGKADFVLLEKDGVSGTYDCHIAKNGSSLSSFSYVTCQLPIPASPKKLFVSDFNSDGMQDMAVFYTGGYRIFWNGGGGLTANTFSLYSTPSSNINDSYRFYEGDFNGDGLLDFLTCEQDSVNWYYLLSNGSGGFTRNLACSIDAYDQSATTADDGSLCCSVFDLDGDGKSDAVISKTKYVPSGLFNHYIPNTTNTFWLLSNGNALDTLKTTALHSITADLARYFITGDFNGDGMVELMNCGRDIYNNMFGTAPINLYRNQSFSIASGKVTGVTDGYSRSSYISYRSLAQDSIYTKGSDGDYPFVDCQIPLHVVSSLTEQSGSIADQTTRYHYGGLKLHLLGKGLQGFTNITATDVLHNIRNETTIMWDSIRVCPSKVTQKQTVYGQTTEEMTTVSTFSYIQPVSSRPSWYHYLSKKVTTGFDNESSEENFYHDTSNGMPYLHTVENDDDLETEERLSDFIFRYGSYLPMNKTTTRWYKNNSNYTDCIHTEYDSHGLPASVITHYNTTLALTTAYTYDSFGNVLTQQATGSGITAQTQQYEYDPTHRFVSRKTENGLLRTSFTYDLWGNVLTSVDETRASSPLTTSYTYDGWGRLATTETPTGLLHTIQRVWGTSPDKCYYVQEQATAQPWVRTWYDNAGREVIKESIGEKGMALSDSTTYNDMGLVIRHKTKKGQLTHTANYAYDARGRVIHEWTNQGSSKTYTYSQRLTTCVDNGRTNKYYYDSWGNVVKTVGPQGVTVETFYGSNGKPLRVLSGGKNVVMTYDTAGNRTSLTDPDAGQQSYTYDALGRVISQTDAQSNTTAYTYNAFGKVASIVTNGSYTRSFNYATEGSNIGRLMSETGGNRTVNYTYDQYNRVVTEQITGAGGYMNYAYSYNTQGLLSQKTMTGCPAITYSYDAYGFKTATQLGGQEVWALTTSNGMLRVETNSQTVSMTTILNSAGRTSTLLAKRGNQPISMLQYTWNNNLGNVTVRKGMFAQQENFTYDDLDRLTKTTIAGQESVYSYATNGNILSKTGIGNYEYDDNYKPHAVVDVDNSDALIPLTQQMTVYGPIGKILHIEEAGTGFSADFLYGPDDQRMKMTVSRGTTVLKDYCYLPDVDTEYNHETTCERRFYYVDENVLFVKDCRLYPSGKVFFLVTDHLGSIVRIVDDAGDEFFAATYDAWGRQTVTRDSLGFRRGYTGHEHLPEFGLINMNGRLYDPLIARFLSCDNFVQEPANSQSFNRYSYCLNNPLKYNDPSGEIAWFVPVIAGAIIGAYTGASIQSGSAAFWNWKSDAWKGAIVGGIFGGALGFQVSTAMYVSGFNLSGLMNSIEGVEVFTKAAGITNSIMQGGVVNIGLNTITGGGWNGAWKAGLVGLATGAWAITGGFGMSNGYGTTSAIGKIAGKMGYQMIGTTSMSIGRNWAMNEKLLSNLTLGIGPVNLTIGGKRVLRWENNVGNIFANIAGVSNLAFGGRARFDWQNLSFGYTGGLRDKLFGLGTGFGSYSIFGDNKLFTDKETFTHELHHLWQSRVMNNLYLPNYFANGISSIIYGNKIYDCPNYYEQIGYFHYWYE